MWRTILLIAGILLIVLGISWGYRFSSPRSGPSAEDSLSPAVQMVPPQKSDSIAVLETTYGIIKFKLFPEFAPETVKNFTELANRGFFNGLIFHRVINNFMIQTGDPLGNGAGGETYLGPGTTLPDEISILRHIPGAVSMANRSSPNTGSSQFFIVQRKGGPPDNQPGTHWLDGKHTVFGQVVEGMGVVDAIAAAKVGPSDRPQSPITIIRAEIKSFSAAD